MDYPNMGLQGLREVRPNGGKQFLNPSSAVCNTFNIMQQKHDIMEASPVTKMLTNYSSLLDGFSIIPNKDFKMYQDSQIRKEVRTCESQRQHSGNASDAVLQAVAVELLQVFTKTQSYPHAARDTVDGASVKHLRPDLLEHRGRTPMNIMTDVQHSDVELYCVLDQCQSTSGQSITADINEESLDQYSQSDNNVLREISSFCSQNSDLFFPVCKFCSDDSGVKIVCKCDNSLDIPPNISSMLCGNLDNHNTRAASSSSMELPRRWHSTTTTIPMDNPRLAQFQLKYQSSHVESKPMECKKPPVSSKFLQQIRDRKAESQNEQKNKKQLEACNSVTSCEDKIARLKDLLSRKQPTYNVDELKQAPMYVKSQENSPYPNVDATSCDSKEIHCDNENDIQSSTQFVSFDNPSDVSNYSTDSSIITKSELIDENIEQLGKLMNKLTINDEEHKTIVSQASCTSAYNSNITETNSVQDVSSVENHGETSIPDYHALPNECSTENRVETSSQTNRNICSTDNHVDTSIADYQVDTSIADYQVHNACSPQNNGDTNLPDYCAVNSVCSTDNRVESSITEYQAVPNVCSTENHVVDSSIPNHQVIDNCGSPLVSKSEVVQCSQVSEKASDLHNDKICSTVLPEVKQETTESDAHIISKDVVDHAEVIRLEQKEEILKVDNNPMKANATNVSSIEVKDLVAIQLAISKLQKEMKNKRSKIQKNHRLAAVKINENDLQAGEFGDQNIRAVQERLSPSKERHLPHNKVCNKKHKNEHCSKKHRHKEKESHKKDIKEDLTNYDYSSESTEPIYFSPENLKLLREGTKKLKGPKKLPSSDKASQSGSSSRCRLSESMEKCVNFISNLPSQISTVCKSNSSSNTTETLSSTESEDCQGFDEIKGRFKRNSSEYESDDSFVIVFSDKGDQQSIKQQTNNTQKDISKQRVRMPSECESDDSFVICFEGESSPADGCYGNDEVYSDSDSDSSGIDMESDTESEDEELDSDMSSDDCKTVLEQPPKLKSILKRRSSPKPEIQKNEKKVIFDANRPKVHKMVVWSYAYRQARIGPWERYGRDTERFKQRIRDTEVCLEWVFKREHRNRIFFQRFRPLLMRAIREEKEAKARETKRLKEEEDKRRIEMEQEQERERLRLEEEEKKKLLVAEECEVNQVMEDKSQEVLSESNVISSTKLFHHLPSTQSADVSV